MTSININNFVEKASIDFLLIDGEGYEIRVKKMDSKQVFSVHCGHTQFMEIMTKYNLKPVWTTWVNDEDPKKRGKYVPVK